MTADEKFQEQLNLAGQVLLSYADLPIGKTLVTIAALWLSYFHSPLIEWKMLSCIPVVSFFDYVTGTIRAMFIKRNWTPAASTMGFYRWFVWSVLLLVMYLASEVFGRWLFVGTVSAVFVTENASLLENIRGSFPTSRLSLFIAVLLQFFNRKYVDVINEFASLQANKQQQEKEAKASVLSKEKEDNGTV